MLVELKNGETLNGHLVLCDTWMNLTLKEVVQTSPVRWLAVMNPSGEADSNPECRRATDSCGYQRSM